MGKGGESHDTIGRRSGAHDRQAELFACASLAHEKQKVELVAEIDTNPCDMRDEIAGLNPCLVGGTIWCNALNVQHPLGRRVAVPAELDTEIRNRLGRWSLGLGGRGHGRYDTTREEE